MRIRRFLGSRLLVAGLAALLASGSGVVASSASADSAPTDPSTPPTVTADALPTLQVDGVVWSQVVVGDTVYAGGKFTNARPAGAAPGTSTTPRSNLLAYDIRTGALITSFAPNLNGQVLGVTASPDGSRVYVVGEFTTADGVMRNRIAAYDTATGKLVTSFASSLDYRARTVVATASAVYVGGAFGSANGKARTRLAAFTTTGSLLTWAPTADAPVYAMVMTPDKSKVVVGGQFAALNGATALGLGALDPVSGVTAPWAASQQVQNSGTNAAINSLSVDGDKVYGTGYVFGPGGNLEGTFAADGATGNLVWVEDCHGDTYSSFPSAGVVYTVSHAHYCGNMGGFPETDPRTHHHALAFTSAATGVLQNDTQGYYNWGGTPAPSLLTWFPDLDPGTYTGQNQAAWSVTGNSQYVVMGGEFPRVNGVAQQGLVRFAVTASAPNAQGPRLKGSSFVPSLLSPEPGAARVSWPANYDRDSEQLTYKVFRDSDNVTPVYTTTAKSTFWRRPTLGFVDRGLAPGSTHRYRVTATDATGNTVPGDFGTVVVTSAPLSTYAQDGRKDGASAYWRLGEAGGVTAYDYAGYDDMTLGAGVARGAAGPVSGDADTASVFDGTGTASGSSGGPTRAPDVFSVEAWFKTSSSSGGKIIGYGDKATGASNNYDRHVYMDDAGHLVFGVYSGGTRTLASGLTYNDDKWHHVVAGLSGAGMSLWVDARRVGSDPGTVSGQPFSGYWRVGGDNVNGWPAQPSSNTFAGSLDEVAVYRSPLTGAQVQQHYADSGRTVTTGVKPSDAYGAAVYSGTPDSYWRLGEGSGPTASDATPNGNDAVYAGGVAYGAAGAVPNSGSAVTLDGVDGAVAAGNAVDNPMKYSEEMWFTTTTTRGGKLIGFGSSQTGRSGSYDRHVYMTDDGRLHFGTWTGTANVAETSMSYNDGRWHHMVATQGADGMKLYVDGGLVASNQQTGAQPYGGFWRVGGDNCWGGNSSDYFAGSVDEVAIYPRAITGTEVLDHFRAGGGRTANAAPSAAFSTSSANLVASFDASASTDADGSVMAYSWSFGDGSTGSGVSPDHTYAAPGTYSTTLTVTDDGGATGTTSRDVTVTAPAVVPNAAPTAAFSSTSSGLAAAFDGSGSSDSDGSVTSYAWDFGDQSASGAGPTVQHTYGAAGTYRVALTVQDDKGAANTVVHAVSVTVPAPVAKPYASDAFARTVTGGFGSADVGGAWTVSGGSSNFSVGNGVGQVQLAAPGAGLTATLPSVMATDTDLRASVALNAAATGGGTYVSLLGRRVSATDDYRLKVRVQGAGSVTMSLVRTVSGTETSLASSTVSGLTYNAGDVLQVRLQVVGTAPTLLNAKVWRQGQAEPAAWLLTATDSSQGLQAPGTIGVYGYLSSTSSAPVAVSVDDLSAGPRA